MLTCSYGESSQDEFTVFERSRWTGAKRHIFLLEQRLVITKEKGDDGMYMYKDSLKIHNLALAEKEGDSPCRFAVGTGQIGLWDQFYILDAGTAEKKQLWLTTIKDILKQQFELLKGESHDMHIISHVGELSHHMTAASYVISRL